MTTHAPALFLGIDLGTSGCRGCLIDADGRALAMQSVALPPPVAADANGEHDAMLWWNATAAVIRELAPVAGGDLLALAVDGTSGTLLLTDADGRPRGPALRYDDARAVAQATTIRDLAPRESGAHGATSGLAKLLWLDRFTDTHGVAHALHQADWIAGRLLGRFGASDENNALKLGYDPVERRWPDWLDALDVPRTWLPQVVAPGTPLGTVDATIAQALGLPPHCFVVAGTTDSIAGFLATGACKIGEAVTALGSTIALKIVSDRPVFDPDHGVYSHRLWDTWLAGGASNSGGAVLRQFFSQAQLDALTPLLDPDRPTGLDYYPLPRPGERFPHADPDMQPRMTPRPEDDRVFLQALLEGMAAIEAEGYRRLAALGAPTPVNVRTTGGGAVNAAWTRMRERALGVPVIPASQADAAYGAALLARRAVTG
ncbi:MAG: FGGY-family carbohydrate kinase [Ectothiorhodospiraceae bacterium]|jgi:sugar (pentulose or hexulose) kinase|nr:FGGY-family carbohydrate kinase [Ectothiorhodospiraceae bacterium]